MKEISRQLAGHMPGDYLGKRFRDARLNAGLTIKAAADKIGMTPGHLGRLERGGVSMVSDPATLVRAANVYGVPQVWLYAGAAGGQRFVPEWYHAEKAA